MMFTWEPNPELFRIGAFAVRYYGLLFVAVFIGGFYFLRRQMMRVGWREQDVSDFVIPGMLAVIIGSRLGHAVFYEPGYYFSHPLEIIKFWKGGLASHGATLGLVVAGWWFARRKRMAFTEFGDRFAFSAATGAALVRLGNFFNSEIVGRATDQTWGVRFPLSHEDRMLAPDQIPLRHPSQLYEFLMGAAILGLLLLVDRKYGEKRPRGLLISLFLILYFMARFIVEFFKEFQGDLKEVGGLTMGQLLSIPLFFAGVIWLVWSIRRKLPAASVVPHYVEPAESKSTAPSKPQSLRTGKKRK